MKPKTVVIKERWNPVAAILAASASLPVVLLWWPLAYIPRAIIVGAVILLFMAVYEWVVNLYAVTFPTDIGDAEEAEKLRHAQQRANKEGTMDVMIGTQVGGGIQYYFRRHNGTSAGQGYRFLAASPVSPQIGPKYPEILMALTWPLLIFLRWDREDRVIPNGAALFSLLIGILLSQLTPPLVGYLCWLTGFYAYMLEAFWRVGSKEVLRSGRSYPPKGKLTLLRGILLGPTVIWFATLLLGSP